MSFYIHTPASTDRYSLTSDLTILATDVSSHLDNLQTAINLCVHENTSPTFTSIMTVSAPIFPAITLTGTRPNATVINNSDGFGLKSASLKFSTTNDSNWASNGPITVPDSGAGSQVVNGNTLTSALTPLINRIAALESTVTSLSSGSATKTYVDTQDAALSSAIATAQAKANLVDSKADAWNGDTRYVEGAMWAKIADSAGSAGSAGDAGSLTGRRWNIGAFDAGTTAAGANGYHDPIEHFLGVEPGAVLAMAYNDSGHCSIVCSIDYKNASSFRVNWRNLNVKDAENAQICWLAVT